jgi:hypothetical protein
MLDFCAGVVLFVALSAAPGPRLAAIGSAEPGARGIGVAANVAADIILWGVSGVIAAILLPFAGSDLLIAAAWGCACFLLIFLAATLRRSFQIPRATAAGSSSAAGARALGQAGLWFDAVLVCPVFAATITSTPGGTVRFVLGALVAAVIVYTLVSDRELSATPRFWFVMRLAMALAGATALALLINALGRQITSAPR